MLGWIVVGQDRFAAEGQAVMRRTKWLELWETGPVDNAMVLPVREIAHVQTCKLTHKLGSGQLRPISAGKMDDRIRRHDAGCLHFPSDWAFARYSFPQVVLMV